MPCDETEKPGNPENAGASVKNGGRPMDTISGLPRLPDDGRILSGFPTTGPAAPRLPIAAVLVSAPTIFFLVRPVRSPPAPNPYACDTDSRAKPPDPGAAVAASSQSGLPNARIK